MPSELYLLLGGIGAAAALAAGGVVIASAIYQFLDWWKGRPHA